MPGIAIGFTSVTGLALFLAGAVSWSMLFGWDARALDVMLLVLFMFGAWRFARTRRDRGGLKWRDLLLFGLAALVFILPVLILPVPLDTDAQGFGYLALTVRLSGSLHTLSPFHPEVSYLYAPGFPVLAAYINARTGLGLHTAQFGIAALLAAVLVIQAYDLGVQIGDARRGRAMALALLFGGGLVATFIDSHFTTVLALNFALACIAWTLRYLRRGFVFDLLGAGVMLGATILSHPDTTIILALGYVPFLLTIWLSRERPMFKRWLMVVIGVPLIALIVVSPWLLSMRDLLGSEIQSPFGRSLSHWRLMVKYHFPVVPFALIGAVIGVRRRDPLAILAVGWLLLVIDFSMTGILARLLPGIISVIEKYDFPFSIAYHGVIIPYTLLGGLGLLWLWERFAEKRFGSLLHRFAPVLIGGAMALGIGAAVFSPALLPLTKNRLSVYGAFSSHDDVAAMEWIKTNTPPDTRILNYLAPHEAYWAAVITERDAVYFRPQPFFTDMQTIEREQRLLSLFWENPADTANHALLLNAGIDYVLVPQIIVNPSAWFTLWRWESPFTAIYAPRSQVSDASYLSLVFDRNGAQVYQVLPQ